MVHRLSDKNPKTNDRSGKLVQSVVQWANDLILFHTYTVQGLSR